MGGKKITGAEVSFCMYKLNMAGAFKTKLYNLFWVADTTSQNKLITIFPELEIARKFNNERGYWPDLIRRWNKHNPNLKLHE